MKYLKYSTVIVFLIFPSIILAQRVDSTYLKSLYDRCLDFTEEKADSIKYYADFIHFQSKKSGFIKGDVLSLRLRGIHQELKNNYEKAIDFYLQSLEEARRINGLEYESAALSDLSIVYSYLKRPDKAKEMYLESARLSEKRGDLSNLTTTYINLGAIYNKLQLQDSALAFLNKALKLSKPLENKIDLSSLYNNLGSVYYQSGNYDGALELFRKNMSNHSSGIHTAELWLDYLNIADVFIEKKKYDSARWYADSSLSLALALQSKSKEADSYDVLARLFSRKGNYEEAFKYQQKWYSIDTSLVNSEINHSIVGLQEKYNAREREHQNLLLSAAIEKEKLRSQNIAFLAIAAGLVAALIAGSLIQKRRANKKLLQVNELITRQNDMLAVLNSEKNSLISIVSHDLSGPFASIKMWGHILQADNAYLNNDQRKAVERIVSSTQNGERLIRTILDVEKAETNQHIVNLEEFDLNILAENLVSDCMSTAAKKGIHLHIERSSSPAYIISDRQLVTRIFENLLSNAMKFTPAGKNVWLKLTDEKKTVNIEVKDEGVGIPPEDLPNLYSKYSKISSRPTNGEASTGLGLSIVKRLVEEINGKIQCQSIVGIGSNFTVTLKK
ncbi:MAG: tetratricopeptide repeat protein [Chitinophagaceae bacterium]